MDRRPKAVAPLLHQALQFSISGRSLPLRRIMGSRSATDAALTGTRASLPPRRAQAPFSPHPALLPVAGACQGEMSWDWVFLRYAVTTARTQALPLPFNFGPRGASSNYSRINSLGSPVSVPPYGLLGEVGRLGPRTPVYAAD